MVECALSRLPGTYALILRAPAPQSVRAGRLGLLPVRPGTYVYVGSAFGPGGLRGRIGHHAGPCGSPHWHIDYLRPAVRIEQVWYSHDPTPREHDWAAILGATRGASIPLNGFGASDCACASHLLAFESEPSVRTFRALVQARLPDHGRIEALAASRVFA